MKQPWKLGGCCSSLTAAWLVASPALWAQPVNDNFADRIVLSGDRVTTTGTNSEATREDGEPDVANGNSSTRLRTVWWSWTAPTDGLLVVRSLGDKSAAWVDVFTGSTLDQLRLVSLCGSPEPGCDTTRVGVSAGTSYQIVVAGTADYGSDFLLNLAFFPRPANDDFADRIHLGSGNVAVTMTNTAATTEAGEGYRSVSYSDYGRSLWWSWTAPASGPVSIGLEAGPCNPDALAFGGYPGGRTAVGVYLGSSLNALTYVTNRDSPDFLNAPIQCQVTIEAVAGTTYQIATDGVVDLFRAVTLRIARTRPPLVLMTMAAHPRRFYRAVASP